MAKAIMIQGAGSNVGKSLIVAGLARAFARKGLKVAPFKPQNMSNNAAVTVDGGEIGRAQALQARAASRAPTVHMNPVLLKPESESGAQIVVQGQRFGTLAAQDFGKMKHRLMPKILESFDRLCREADLIIVEGAGSPAETNLRAGDIANMGFAQAARVPVLLVGDIDRGGVIAQLVGTHAVLDHADRDLIKGFIINKFRGDMSLFDEGMAEIQARTGWHSAGLLGWFESAWRLPAEDILDIKGTAGGAIKIAVPRLRRIANFDDLDPLLNESDVSIQIVEPGSALPGDANLVLIPGSKSTIADLSDFRKNGWDIDLRAHHRRGGHTLGICGGYQMLGRTISDPNGIEGPAISVEGLGLLDVETEISGAKTLALTDATDVETGDRVEGYEIHLGTTQGPDCENAWLQTKGKPHGAQTSDGRVRGAYLHGIFSSDAFRGNYLQRIGGQASAQNYSETVEKSLDDLADQMANQLDLPAILKFAGDTNTTK